MDIGVFKLENCPAGTAWKKAKPEANPAPAPLKLEAAMPCITADAEIAAALQLEQAELERLNTLQALMTEQQHLEGLLAEMEAQIQAKQAQAAKVSNLPSDVEMPQACHLSRMVICCSLCVHLVVSVWGQGWSLELRYGCCGYMPYGYYES